MKKLALILAVIMIVLSFAGCSSKQPASAPTSSAPSYNGGAKPGDAASPEQSKDAVPAADTKDQSLNIDSNRKIVYNAFVSIDVKDIKSTGDSITSKSKEMGGYIANSSFNETYCQITVKVPAERLDEFLSFVDTLGGENKQASISTDDITDQYTDTTSRIRNLQAEETQLLEIMKKAATVDEILKVQDELYTVRGEIETLQGKVNMWDKLVEMSTVSITLKKIPEIGGKEVNVSFISWNEIWEGITNGFNAVLNLLMRFFSWLLIVLVSCLPIYPFVGVALWLTIRYMKKHRRK